VPFFYGAAAPAKSSTDHLRHLLLLIRDQSVKHKFLCGHDERDWFAAAVPDVYGVSNVRTAMEALKPAEVVVAQMQKNVKMRLRNRRRNDAFIRQGEWFFIPEPEVNPAQWLILKNEPLLRGRGKPHMAELAFRTGGTEVYVSRTFPNGLSPETYRQRVQSQQILADKVRTGRAGIQFIVTADNSSGVGAQEKALKQLGQRVTEQAVKGIEAWLMGGGFN